MISRGGSVNPCEQSIHAPPVTVFVRPRGRTCRSFLGAPGSPKSYPLSMASQVRV
jgi:hypothetical protein